MKRRLPKPSELRPLLGLSRPVMRTSDKLARAATVEDVRDMAMKRAPRPVFDYTDGAAGHELSMTRSRQAYQSVEFTPQTLIDVAAVDTSTMILGEPSAMPLVCAPTGFTRMMHSAGEPAVVRAAHRAGIPYALSTLGTTSPEGVAEACPDANRWFQLYLWNDREASGSLIRRAKNAGFSTLILTIDTPVAGERLRDVRNGLTIPPKLTPRTLANMARHPRWWADLLTSEPLEFASLSSFDGTVAELVNQLFDPALNMSDLAWAMEQWDGPVVVKGIQTVSDAERVVAQGVDGLILSNHGGRQLDQAPTPLRVLPSVVAAVGDRCSVMIDGGVMSGSDVAAAVGLGADAVLIGRAYLYGLMAAGEAGVERVLELMGGQMRRTMQLTGAVDIRSLRGRVKLLS